MVYFIGYPIRYGMYLFGAIMFMLTPRPEEDTMGKLLSGITESVGGDHEELEVGFQLWQTPLYQPAGLLNMLEFNSKHFFSLMQTLAKAGILSKKVKNLDIVTSDAQKATWIGFLDILLHESRAIGLDLSSAHIASLQFQANHLTLKHCDIYEGVMVLKTLVFSEIESRALFIIKSEDRQLFEEKLPFGDEVYAHFTSASFEIQEAAKCLALDRNTACVLHLMRALDVALGALAKDLKIPFKHENWEKIINQIRPKIQEMERRQRKPKNWRELRQFYSEVGDNFRSLKDAYRNYAMHGKKTYGREEAKDIFHSVRIFMTTLAKRLREDHFV